MRDLFDCMEGRRPADLPGCSPPKRWSMIQNRMPCTMLRDALEAREGAVWRGYARYWHGNTVPVSLALAAFAPKA